MTLKFDRSIILPLSSCRTKGEFGFKLIVHLEIKFLGRIAVVGGSLEYTGAPFFTAMSALRTGADMSFILCSRSAAIPIKSYSPEVIVYPILPDYSHPKVGPEEISIIDQILSRVHIIVFGPGLGRDERTQLEVVKILSTAQNKGIPCIIDGDAIGIIAREPSLVLKGTNTIITPNFREFTMLCEKNQVSPNNDKAAQMISQIYKGSLVISKRDKDELTVGNQSLSFILPKIYNYLEIICDYNGSLRRCGGQGDLLVGILATFWHWAKVVKQNQQDKDQQLQVGINACILLRTAASLSFLKNARGSLATDILNQIPIAFAQIENSSTD